MAIYLILDGGRGEDEWTLAQGENQIGRSPKGDGRHVVIAGVDIPDLESMSRHHVCVNVSGNRITIRKVPGTVSVLVNGTPLADEGNPVELHDSDRLVLGKVVLRLSVGPARPTRHGRHRKDTKAGPSETETLKADPKEIEQLACRCERLEKAVAATRRVLEQDDPEAALSKVLEEAVAAFGLQCGVVADHDEAGRLRGCAFVGLERIEDLSNVSQRIIRQALETGRPFMTHDAPKQFQGQPGGSLKAMHIGPALCAPLRSGKNNLGVIYLDKRNVDDWEPFTKDDEQYLESFAAIVAGALVSIRDRQRAELEAVLARAQIVGRSDVMLALARQIRRVTQAIDRNPKVPVLILGPPGAGKELIARAIRMETARRAKAYVRINIGEYTANPEHAHSALFGHRKGAYTGALEDRPGAVGAAEGGSLFLDEIGDMPREVQRLFKRFLAEESYGTFCRLGEPEKERHADVVIVMATNKDLWALAEKGEFETDVVRRLTSGHVIRVPSLADHREDIPEIVSHYLAVFNEKYDRQVSLSADAVQSLLSSAWQANVGGLRAVVHTVVVHGEDREPVILGRNRVEQILQVMTREGGQPSPPKALMNRALWDVELDHCLAIWEACGRHYRRASERLEIAENTLRKRLLEGQLRRLTNDLDRVAEFFGKSRKDIEGEIATHKVARAEQRGPREQQPESPDCG